MADYSPNSQRRILIVDDDHELRTMLGLALTGEGYAVSHADNGNEAVSLHNRNPFDLIITELILEDKDGFKTLMELRRHPAPAKLIATAKEHWLSTSLCLRMAKHLGAHSVLSKPFEPEQLLVAVKDVLNAPGQ
jgi:DNA-binding response OmpR family regulator